MLIGICGKSGSGKSTLSRQLTEYYKNTIYLDVDKIGHSALETEEVKNELINCFGSNICDENKIDRKKLGDIVFNSRKSMTKLSDITWKYMENQIDEIINKNKDKIIILDWLLLCKTKFFKMCDIKVLLDIPYEVRKERAIARDNITEEEFDLRDKNSVSFDEKDFDIVYTLKSINKIERLTIKSQ